MRQPAPPATVTAQAASPTTLLDGYWVGERRVAGWNIEGVDNCGVHGYLLRLVAVGGASRSGEYRFSAGRRWTGIRI